ncbi:MAG: DUF3021 family protein [Turicibacter sp.]
MMIKRGLFGALISLVAVISLVFGIAVMAEKNTMTVDISLLITLVGCGFLIGASTIIFSFKKVSYWISGIIHCIVMFYVLKNVINDLGIVEMSYLIQAIFIAVYLLIYAICLFSIVHENQKDVKLINERLKSFKSL